MARDVFKENKAWFVFPVPGTGVLGATRRNEFWVQEKINKAHESVILLALLRPCVGSAKADDLGSQS